MKKILSFLGTITLIGTSTTSLVACNTPQQYTEEKLAELKEENKININGNTLEWMESQEKPFNKVDNKWYFVIWRGNKNHDWRIGKFQNSEKIRLNRGFKLVLDYYGKVDDLNKINLVFDAEVNNLRVNDQIWTSNSINFKSVYRWGGEREPDTLIIDSKTGKVTDLNKAKEDKEDKEVKEDKEDKEDKEVKEDKEDKEDKEAKEDKEDKEVKEDK